MNVSSFYSLNQPYMRGAYTGRQTAKPAGLFQAGKNMQPGFSVTGAVYTRSEGQVSALKGMGAVDLWQLRRKLGSNQSAQEAVITVIDKENKEKTNAADDTSEQNTKRIINAQALTAKSSDRMNGLLDLTGTQQGEEEDPLEEKFQYNSQEVSAEVQRAKTSTGAGQAAIKATRKVMELKRRLAAGKDDPEEIALALAHAKRIERVAKKKRRHLEMEELIAATQERDDRQQKAQESSTSVSPWDGRDISEEELTDELSEMDRQQAENFAAIAEAGRAGQPENAGNIEEMVLSIDAFLEKFGGKEQQVLEEALEQLELTEVVDPHMSREDLDMLKIKHRNAERKDIVKADMDYLKEFFGHMQKKGVTLPVFARESRVLAAAYIPGIPLMTAGINPAALGSSAVDVQV